MVAGDARGNRIGAEIIVLRVPAALRSERVRVLINGLHAKSGGGVTYLRNMLPRLANDGRLELHLFFMSINMRCSIRWTSESACMRSSSRRDCGT